MTSKESARGRARDIKEACEAAPWPLLYCPRCPNTMASSYEQDFRYPWSMKLKCPRCKSEWWVCRKCENQRAHLQSLSQASRHNRLKHKEDPNPGVEPLEETVPADADSPMINMNFMTRLSSAMYFQSSKKGKGLEYMANKALYKTANVTGTFHPEDLEMFMCIGHFVSTITRTQREGLVEVLQKTTQATRREFTSHPQKRSSLSLVSIPVPTKKNMIRSWFIEGKHSLFNNLPHPAIETLGEHAYLLPSECLADLMGHGQLDSKTKKTIHGSQTLGLSPLACELVANDSKIKGKPDMKSVFLSIWSDDFEPNYSKGNRGSVWLATLTFQSPDSDNQTLSHTYPIAIGPKGDDHNNVVALILDDIKRLESERPFMYNGSTRREESVTAHLIVVTQDQPERRGFAGLLLGGQGYHARWGWSVDLSQHIKQMPPCTNCRLSMQSCNGEDVWDSPACSECYNWMLHPHQIESDPPEGFPLDAIVEETRKLPTIKLTFAILKEAVLKTHDKLVTGEWMKGTAREYLKVHCLNTDSQNGILECAGNCASWIQANEAGADIEFVNACTEESQLNPDKWERWAWPPIWNTDLDLQQSTEPCMHLLFLGITKSLVFELQDWAAMRNKYTSLRSTIQRLTGQVETLHLSWCKVEPYKGEKLGGWVSENFVGFARICPWAYSCLLHLTEDEVFTPAPDKPIRSYTLEECKTFLRQRRLPLGGKVKVLRDRVEEHKSLPIPPPAGGPVREIQTVVLTLWSMLCHLMGISRVDDIQVNVSQRLIRQFLTAVADHDKSTRAVNQRKIPFWLSQYNFMSLLNIPDQMERLGPIRNRWEGSVRGEGFLRFVKPVIQSRRQNWQKNLLSNILRQKTMLQIKNIDTMKQMEVTSDDPFGSADEDDEKIHHDPQSFVVYGSLAELVRDHTQRKPLSCVISLDAIGRPAVWCCYRYGPKKLVWQLNVHGRPEYVFGLWYHQMNSTENEDDNESITLDELIISSYGILLPLVLSTTLQHGEPESQSRYAVLTSDWQTLNEDKLLRLPHSYTNREFTVPS